MEGAFVLKLFPSLASAFENVFSLPYRIGLQKHTTILQFYTLSKGSYMKQCNPQLTMLVLVHTQQNYQWLRNQIFMMLFPMT